MSNLQMKSQVRQLAPMGEARREDRALATFDTLVNAEPGYMFLFEQETGLPIFVIVAHAPRILYVPDESNGLREAGALHMYGVLDKAQPGDAYWLYLRPGVQVQVVIAECNEID